MTQKENDRVPFSLRECKDRKKGLRIASRIGNIFWVRLLVRVGAGVLARTSPPAPSPMEMGSLTLGWTPGIVLFLAGKRALQCQQQEEHHEG